MGQKQLQHVVYFNYLDSMLTNDARCTREIKSRIVTAKAVLAKRRLVSSANWKSFQGKKLAK
jgi:hypothetical protein